MFIPQRTEASIAAEKAGHGTYAVDWATADDRIRLCKGIVTDTNQQMDPERLSVLKAVYEENLGEEPVLIRAKLLERLLLTKKLFLDENPVVGTLTSIRCGLYAIPSGAATGSRTRWTWPRSAPWARSSSLMIPRN